MLDLSEVKGLPELHEAYEIQMGQYSDPASSDSESLSEARLFWSLFYTIPCPSRNYVRMAWRSSVLLSSFPFLQISHFHPYISK